jgi:two-component system sensor histidine kinase YesM
MQFAVNLQELLKSLPNRLVNGIRRLPIYYRLVLSFSLVIVIPGLIIGYISYNISSRELENNIFRYTYQYISNINTNTAERLKKYEEMTYQIYDDSRIRELLAKCREAELVRNYRPEELKKYSGYKKELDNILYNAPGNDKYVLNVEIINDWDEFTQINYNGDKKGGKVKELQKFRDSLYFKKTLDAKGDPVWYDTSKDNAIISSQSIDNYYISNHITILRSIPDPDGNIVLGVIVMNISLKIFSDTFKVKEIIDSGNLLLVGDRGAIASLNENINGPFLDRDTESMVARLESGKIIKKVNGVECLVTFQKSEYTGWSIVSLIPRKALLTSAYAIRRIIVATTVACLILSLIIAYIVTLSISRPMKNLRNVMDSFGENNTNIEYVDDKKDDIGIFAEKFNNMIKRINHLINTIYKVELMKKSEEAKRKQAELDALQMQINPHFIYNTLDVVRWEAIAQEKGEGKVSRMITEFSELLRLSTKRSGSLVDIEEEFDHVVAYLKVISFSYAEKFTIDWDIESESIRKGKITKLTLQPLVENAVVHGFANVKTEKNIRIGGYRVGGDVVLEIEDNGIGMNESRLSDIKSGLEKYENGTKNLGLRNVNERIKLTFGEKYGLAIDSREGKGTCVTVRVPWIEANEIRRGDIVC